MSTLTTLSDDPEREIRYVYHLSDIHIRSPKRREEYKQVFERTYEKIISESEGKGNQSLIVLTGDIMHHKSDISTEAWDMMSKFFERLSDILPVIIIAGNHDCVVTNPDRMDAITAFIDNKRELKNFYYLKKTGLYKYDNIIFGLTDIYTMEIFSAENITNQLMSSLTQENKYKIALYHGQIRGAVTDQNYKIKSEKIRANDFGNYHYGFFGDIHKHQYLNENKTFAYAGSLIQQTHGESLKNHGILKWDLLKNRSKLLEIENDYGFCTINVLNGEMIDTIIPKKPNIRLFTENTSRIQIQEIEKKLREEYEINGFIKIDNTQNTIVSDLLNNNKDPSIVNANYEKFIKKFLKNKTDLNETERKNIFKLHQKIYAEHIDEHDDNSSLGGQHWKLIEIQFSNMFCYGKNNIINFNKYTKNQIIGIVAPNHYGKSAILDIILYCLFEKCSRGKSTEILNRDTEYMECSIEFEINSERYLIKRTLNKKATAQRTMLKVDFMSISKNGTKKMLNGDTKKVTDQDIIKLIGPYEDYLTTCICIQQHNKQHNFADMSNGSKKEYLSRILNLNKFDRCRDYAKIKYKEYSNKLKIMENMPANTTSDIKEEIKKIKETLKHLQMDEVKTEGYIGLINMEMGLKTNKMPELVKYDELSIYDLNSEKKIDEVINDLTNKLNDISVTNIKNKILEYTKKITELENNNANEQTIKDYIDKRDKLYQKRTNIPPTISELDINSLEIEKDELCKQLDIINEYLQSQDEKYTGEKNIKEKISKIEKRTKALKKIIKYIDPESEEQLQSLTKTLKNKEIQLINESTDYMNNTYINEAQRINLTN